jgi:hypothetical protein
MRRGHAFGYKLIQTYCEPSLPTFYHIHSMPNPHSTDLSSIPASATISSGTTRPLVPVSCHVRRDSATDATLLQVGDMENKMALPTCVPSDPSLPIIPDRILICPTHQVGTRSTRLPPRHCALTVLA